MLEIAFWIAKHCPCFQGYGTTAHTSNKDEISQLLTEGMSKEDKRAQEILDKTFTMNDGHYETGLL
jgi:hypothetical protein